MFIYFLEQVWTMDKDWSLWGWETQETSRRFWDHFHYSKGYEWQIVYPSESMEMGIDYIEL